MMDYEKEYKQALERAKKLYAEAKANEYASDVEDYEFIFPELAESEDERVLRFLKDQAIEWIASLEHDISQSIYDGIEGHDPEAEEELERWRSALSWLEKQKEQKPAEWSEEEMENINAICSYLDSYCRLNAKDSYGVEECKVRKEWLKSLRPSWKPSELRWRKWHNGACGNGEHIPIALVKVGCSYALTDCLGINGQEYIMLSDLEKLPKEE